MDYAPVNSSRNKIINTISQPAPAQFTVQKAQSTCLHACIRVPPLIRVSETSLVLAPCCANLSAIAPSRQHASEAGVKPALRCSQGAISALSLPATPIAHAVSSLQSMRASKAQSHDHQGGRQRRPSRPTQRRDRKNICQDAHKTIAHSLISRMMVRGKVLQFPLVSPLGRRQRALAGRCIIMVRAITHGMTAMTMAIAPAAIGSTWLKASEQPCLRPVKAEFMRPLGAYDRQGLRSVLRKGASCIQSGR